MTDEEVGPSSPLEMKFASWLLSAFLVAMVVSVIAGQAITDFAHDKASWLPGLHWLVAIASSNDVILRDAKMPGEAATISAFRLMAFLVLVPLSVCGFATLMSRPAGLSPLPDRLPVWVAAIFAVFGWYGLFFDNVAFASYREWYEPSRPMLEHGEVAFVVQLSACIAIWGLPWSVALAVKQRLQGRPPKRS